ncbi:patatin-like protein [Novosphingobium sp. 9]|uniref:patatin-like protein n=1 Tax=Novosphingobium sp. 9 TaxID=2025349 RepID=UPI0021B6AA77|nr:patatin-like protein [Novosphingobium sp. 9]
MRQKELRIALVCYGGVSLAVYMHGVTKELWHALRASQTHWSGEEPEAGVAGVYHRLLAAVSERGLRLKVMADIVTGASAGGVNSVLLAQAIHTGQSLDPLTALWLEGADVDELLDPAAKPGSDLAKFWARPLIEYLLRRPGNAVSETVAPETRTEVRQKLSRLVRSRWFEPPFGGTRFSGLMLRALQGMAEGPIGPPLLPERHPLDLFVTATDFNGHLETLRLNSPRLVRESEHRVGIEFHVGRRGAAAGETASLAPIVELIFAARATSAFPGAFPPLSLAEMDSFAKEHELDWPEREAFLRRILPEHARAGDLDRVALIDGSVLVNAPFAEALKALRNRPAAREVDRRVVYIDPLPERHSALIEDSEELPGFFQVIFGALSSIPREQPIRDNLDAIERTSREQAQLQRIVQALRPEVEDTVARLFGNTLFLDRPTPRRIAAWREKAHGRAMEQAGYAWHGYAQLKFASVVAQLGQLIERLLPRENNPGAIVIADHLMVHLKASGLDHSEALRGKGTPEMAAFLRAHDLPYRIRRLRLLARRLAQDWDFDETVSEAERETARTLIYQALAIYQEKERLSVLGQDLCETAGHVFAEPGAVLDAIAAARELIATDERVDTMLAEAMADMPQPLRRKLLLTYLGFPFYDTVTLPLLRGEGLTEFDPIKVDRISPEDCRSLMSEDGESPLRGAEFYRFGAFFSRAYRENDYLWGRLHGAERTIDLIASTLEDDSALPPADLAKFKREAFAAILEEEDGRLCADPSLIESIRARLSDSKP